MCTTMNELEKVVADYRSLKAMKEELDAQLKDAEREMISYLDSNNKLTESGKDFTIKVYYKRHRVHLHRCRRRDPEDN